MAKFYRKKKPAISKKKRKTRRGKKVVVPLPVNSENSDIPFKAGENAQIGKKRLDNVRNIKRLQKRKLSNILKQNKTLPDVLLNAEKRDYEFHAKDIENSDFGIKFNANQVFKNCYKEFKKVVDAADVVIEVLDARDPLGSRCSQVEQSVISAGPDKRLILLLNKIDLIPRENLEQWLKYLRQEFPTVAFKASTQSQNRNLSQCKVAAIHMNDNLQSSRRCIGAKFLMKVLGNYCRNQNILTSIRVGIVGFPNVGKSSIINSLKRCRTCDVGATPGITKNMQEIILDKHIRLLDSPGVVFAKEGSEASLALRNAVRVETLDDVLTPAEAIIQRADHDELCSRYNVPKFKSVQEFLYRLAKKIGRFKKGGIPDPEAAARKLINDWNSGVIKYYTHPPEVYKPSIHISAEIVQEMSKAFDISTLGEQMELEEMHGEFPEETDINSVPSEITSGTTEVMDVAASHEDALKPMEEKCDKGHERGAPDTLLSATTVTVDPRKDARGRKESENFDCRKYQKNKQRKRLFKKMKKKRKRSEKFVAALAEQCLQLSLS